MKLRLWALFSLLLMVPALAQVPAVRNSTIFYQEPTVAAAAGGCSQYNTWLSATSGTSTLEKTTTQTLICGLVTDGVWTSLDILYWFPTNTATTAKINLKNPGTFNITTTGSCAFTADIGYAGDAATCTGDTGYTPSISGQITQDNVSAGVYITIAVDGGSDIGADNTAGVGSIVAEPGASGQGIWGFNGPGFFTGTATTVGDWVGSRSSSTQAVVELNGTALGGSPFLNTSNTVVDNHLRIWSQSNFAGTAISFTGNTLISAWAGGSLSGAQRTAIHSRLNAACAAMGIGTC